MTEKIIGSCTNAIIIYLYVQQQPKSQDKNLNILGTKRAFKMKSKGFFIVFKGISME